MLTPLWRGGRLQRPAGGWASLTDRLIVAAAPGFGMLLYSAYVYDLTGDPFMWIRLQVAWGRENVGVASFLAGEWDSVGEQGVYQYVSRNVPDFLNILAAGLVTVGFVPIVRRFGAAPGALLVLQPGAVAGQRRLAVGRPRHGGAVPDLPVAGRRHSGAASPDLVRRLRGPAGVRRDAVLHLAAAVLMRPRRGPRPATRAAPPSVW